MSSQKAISMKKLLQVSLFAIISVILTSCKSDNQFTETITPTITSTETPTPTIEPSEEVTSTPTPTKEPTKEPTDTPTVIPTIEPTNTPVPTYTPIPTFTPTPTVENKPTTEPTTVPTATPTETSKPTATPTEAPKPTEEVKPTNTPTPIPEPVAWDAPRERKDIADLLMAKVQAYRNNQGIRKFESPFTYYDVNNPGLGGRLTDKGLRVAKKSCLAHSANHEGGQIGAGIYGEFYTTPANAEEIANKIFTNWCNSPGHNANMLTNNAPYNGVDVAVMTVMEYYDEYGNYQYCAIMSFSWVSTDCLPEGLN